MYHSESVEAFLRTRKTKRPVLDEIKKRMKEVADQEGHFVSADLKYVLGEELAEAYQKATETNPGSMLPAQGSHSTRMGLGAPREATRTFL